MIISHFHHSEDLVELIHACCCAVNIPKLTFHDCGFPVGFALASLSAMKVPKRSFHHCRGGLELVDTCSCPMNVTKLVFHHHGDRVNLVDASLSAENNR